MQGNPTLLVVMILAFVAVVILAQTVMSTVLGRGDRSQRVNRRLTLLDSGLTRDQVYSDLVRTKAPPKFGGTNLASLYTHVDLMCRQAGLAATPLRLGLIALGIAVAIWLVGILVIGARGGNLLVDGPLSLFGALLLSALGVWFWLSNRRTARIKLFNQQLPLALDVVTRAIRAGHPVISAVQLAADELGDPMGTEFGLIVDETTYGAEFKDALANFARRNGSADAHYFAVAVSIQSETGGNLAEILEALSRVMRGRATLVKKVKALSSEGMASAYMLSALPLFLIGVTMVTNPRTYTDKFSDPVFWPIVGVILALYAVGWLMIRRIMNFRY